jgi:hypothetical protein
MGQKGIQLAISQSPATDHCHALIAEKSQRAWGGVMKILKDSPLTCTDNAIVTKDSMAA